MEKPIKSTGIPLKLLLVIALLLASFSLTYSQQHNPYEFQCKMPHSTQPPASSTLTGGLWKPESIIDYTSDENAFFPVLIVYVQFLNDPGPDWQDCSWHVNQPPSFMGSVIATSKVKNFGSNWWDAYNENTQTLSDYWMEVSRGKLHIVGQEVSIILPHEVNWYEGQSNGIQQAVEDLFIALQNNPNINWPDYDKWSKSNNTFHYNQPDGYVDMMYIIARSNPCSIHTPDGYFLPMGIYEPCTCGTEHIVYKNGPTVIKLQTSVSETGSGFQISPGHGGSTCSNWALYAPMNKWGTISFSEHEHGHYFFGRGIFFEYHTQYAKVNDYHGVEEYLSPYELIKLGYQTPQEVDYNAASQYAIGDWTSRGTVNSQILKVPIGDASRNEFFLIANREKISIYDKIMWGDTAYDNPYRNINPDYGKGIYIYHAYPGEVGPGYPWGIHLDQECADGLFNWIQDGYQHPAWSCTQEVPYWVRTNVVYDTNDNGGEIDQKLPAHDGKSLYTWFGLGKKEVPECSNTDGIDKVWTNAQEVWTSCELLGDRWDAWRTGYNEVFSPYSSPSTVNWTNQRTGIFIYLESQDTSTNTANFKIYQVGQTYTESQILQMTPPSKPMGLNISFTDCVNELRHPILTWNHNREPDMIHNSNIAPVKSYRIYRAVSGGLNDVPVNYVRIAQADINEQGIPTFIDNNNYVDCNFTRVIKFTRYRITAVDSSNWESLGSDFIMTGTYKVTGENGIVQNSIPVSFNLSQNYPNPFNASTIIKFDLPRNTYVTIKVYNYLGQEVAILLNNEFKSAGSYKFAFDGLNYATGVYFYRIEAGEFVQTKKMVLIK